MNPSPHKKSLLLLLALALGIHGSTFLLYQDVPLWWDEAHTFWMIEDGIGSVARKCASEVYPPLYFWLVSLATQFLGTSESALRFVSLVAGTLLVWPIYATGDRIGGRRVAIYAGFIAAITPLLNYYSVEARCYTLLVLFLASANYFLVRFLQEPGSSFALSGLVGALTAALYTHHYAVFVLPFPLLYVVVSRFERTVVLKLLLAEVLAFLPYVPWFYFALQARAGTEWISLHWTGWKPWLVMFESLDVMSFGGVYPHLLWHINRANLIPFLGLAIFLMMFLAATYWGHDSRNEASSNYKGRIPKVQLLLAILLIGPMLVAWLHSHLRYPIYIVGRYDLVSYAAIPLVFALGLDRMWSRQKGLAISLCILLILLSGYTWIRMVDQAAVSLNRRIDRTAVHTLRRFSETNDLVICVGMRYIASRYYLQQGFRKKNLEIVTFPESLSGHPCTFWAARELSNKPLLQTDADRIVASAERIVKANQQVFLLQHNEPEIADFLRIALESKFTLEPLDSPILQLFKLNLRK